ncbi:MAG: GNAT family N-acetyltransferase [Maritimibacter sp.]
MPVNRVRKARAKDAVFIHCLHALTHQEHKLRFKDYADKVFDAFWTDALTRRHAALRALIAPPKYQALVALHGREFAGHLLASITMSPQDQSLYFIHDISIAPDHRGQGHGLRLLQAAENIAKTQGMRTLATGIYYGNIQSEGLFAKAGFTHAPSIDPHDIKGNGIYAKDIWS